MGDHIEQLYQHHHERCEKAARGGRREILVEDMAVADKYSS